MIDINIDAAYTSICWLWTLITMSKNINAQYSVHNKAELINRRTAYFNLLKKWLKVLNNQFTCMFISARIMPPAHQ